MSWRCGQAYGQDLRDRVLAAQGTVREVALRYAVSQSFVSRARSRQRRLGQTMPCVQCNHVPARLGVLEQAIKSQVSASPDLTLAQWCQWVLTAHAVKVGQTTMWKMLKRWGLTRKKRLSMPQNAHAPMSCRHAPTGRQLSPDLSRHE